MKKCRECKTELIPNVNWYSSHVKAHSHMCTKCNVQYTKEFRRKHGVKPKRNILERQEGKKYCPKCDTWKLEFEFGKNKCENDGLRPCCRECRKKYSKK